MSKNLTKYHKIGKKIEEFIHPATFPLAIKLIKDASEIPKKSKRPSLDLKIQNFMCQNFKIARTYGWTIAVTEKDCNCKLARTVYLYCPTLSYAFMVGILSLMKWLNG
ncbi:MAG: DUF169 domain-containing protein [Promethearchaeota archaeon]